LTRIKELQGRVKDFAKLVIRRARTGLAIVGPGLISDN